MYLNHISRSFLALMIVGFGVIFGVIFGAFGGGMQSAAAAEMLDQSSAANRSFSIWLSEFQNKALRNGIRAATLQSAFDQIQPIARIIELDQKQPERTPMGFEAYLRKIITQNRIDGGRENYAAYHEMLNRTARGYGVPAEVIVALWGLETSYGANTGGFDVIAALATLAWEGRRRSYFENELMEALMILQNGHVERAEFRGSWAGAMGQNQFMPSSWKRFAVDENGDGHKDIWESEGDVFASSANYLSQNGWNPAFKWGWQVVGFENIPTSYIEQKSKFTLAQWQKMGVRIRGSDDARAGARLGNLALRLVVPQGGNGRGYLVTSNFDVIRTWNKSDYFALTVGILSDLVARQPSPQGRADSGVSGYNP